MDDILILPTRAEHAPAIDVLQELVYDGRGYVDDDSITGARILDHLAVFPEGQFVAIEATSGRVVGHTSSLIIHYDPPHPHLQTWAQITGCATFRTHDPTGEWLYGAESCVHWDFQGKGIGKRLTLARFALCRRLNLRGMISGSVIMNYREVAHLLTPEAYVREVVAGRRFDNNLSKQLKMGFSAGNLIPNYVSDDTSLGWGVALLWYNQDYYPKSMPDTNLKKP